MTHPSRCHLSGLWAGQGALGLTPARAKDIAGMALGLRLHVTMNGEVPQAKLRAELWRGGHQIADVWLNRWVRV